MTRFSVSRSSSSIRSFRFRSATFFIWTDEPALNKCTYFVVIDKLQRAKAVDPSVTERANELISTYSRHTPQAKDLFMLGYKAGDRITIGGWIGESTTIR